MPLPIRERHDTWRQFAYSKRRRTSKDKIRPTAIKVGIRLERGQRLGFHNFRHSLGTFLINKGKDVETVQGLLRHAKASTTLDLSTQFTGEELQVKYSGGFS
jgi:site-specific recombinase XerD